MKSIRHHWTAAFAALAFTANAGETPDSGASFNSRIESNLRQGNGLDSYVQQTQPLQEKEKAAGTTREDGYNPYEAQTAVAKQQENYAGGADISSEKETKANLKTKIGKKSSISSHEQGRLSEATFTEIHFHQIPLSEVVKFLREEIEAQTNEPFNFLFPSTRSDLEVGESLVTIQPPLKNIGLKNLLDVIVMNTDPPVEYRVEDYGIVISLAGDRYSNDSGKTGEPTAEVLEIRIFKVEPEPLYRGLEAAFGIAAPDLSNLMKKTESNAYQMDAVMMERYGLSVPQKKVAENKVFKGAKIENPAKAGQKMKQALKHLFNQLGLEMNRPRKDVFYNPVTGHLMIRATEEDFQVIEAAIITLGGSKVSSSEDR